MHKKITKNGQKIGKKIGKKKAMLTMHGFSIYYAYARDVFILFFFFFLYFFVGDLPVIFLYILKNVE